MPPILTTSAVVTCIHGGQVQLIPKQVQVLVGGAPAVCDPDLMGAPIVGCPVPPSPASKPCTMVISAIGSKPTVLVAGKPVMLCALTGVTDGVPPGTIMVVSPGQATVQA